MQIENLFAHTLFFFLNDTSAYYLTWSIFEKLLFREILSRLNRLVACMCVLWQGFLTL